MGREWRIPLPAVAAFLEEQRTPRAATRRVSFGAWRKQYHYRQLYRLMLAARQDIEDFRRWGLLALRDDAPPANDKEDL